MANKRNSVKKKVKRAVKKNPGLLGRAARGMMSRRQRIAAAVSGKKRK